MKVRETKKPPCKIIDYLPYFLVVAIMSVIVSITCLHEIYSGFIFFCYQIIGIWIPGMACFIALKLECSQECQKWGISYFLGYCINLFEYFSCMLIGLKQYASFICILISIISIVFITRYSGNEHNTDKQNHFGQRIVFASTGFVFFVSLFAGVYCNLVQPLAKEASPVNDILYWIGNIIELTKELPPKDFFNYPNSYSYHYYSSAQLAYASLVTGIRPLHIGLYFSVVQSVLLKCFGGYVVISKCTKNIRFQIIGMVLLLFSSGFESEVIITYLAHSYHASFGLEYALGVYLFFIYLLLLKGEEKENHIKTSVMIWLSLFVLAGEKISYGGIALLGLGVMCASWLFRKEFKKSLITGLPALVIFVLEYALIINTGRYATETSSVGFGGFFSPIYNGYMADMFKEINNAVSGNQAFSVPLFFLKFMALASPVCLFAVIYTVYRITRDCHWCAIDLSFLSMYFIGFFVTIMFSMYGTSNMYFAMASFPAAIIWMVRCDSKWGKIGYAILMIVSTLSIYGFVRGFTYKDLQVNYSLASYINNGYSLLVDGKPNPFAIDERTYVDMEEYEAYEWIRANTKDNEIIAMNRPSKIIGVMTERYTLNPNYENVVFLCNTVDECADTLDQYCLRGVRYVLYEREYGGSDEYVQRKCMMCYESENIRIYDISVRNE